jgi:hypothetical protein
MAIKKKPRKQTGMINLTTLRRLAKKVFGDDTKVYEYPRRTRVGGKVWEISTTGEESVGIYYVNRAVARRALKVALEALT